MQKASAKWGNYIRYQYHNKEKCITKIQVSYALLHINVAVRDRPRVSGNFSAKIALHD